MANKSGKVVAAMAFFQFEQKFPDEKAAVDYFLDTGYRGFLPCPHCGEKTSIYRYRDRPKFFHCYSCGRPFSPFKGTIFKKTHIDMRRRFYAIKLLLNSRKGVSGCRLERELGVTYKTALGMLNQIRTAMENKETESMFDMFVEMDETYAGGKPRKRGKRFDKDGNTIKTEGTKSKRGRGTNKIPAAGLKERATGKVYAQVMPFNEKGQKLTGKQLYALMKKRCKEGTAIATDDFSGYKILDRPKQREKYGRVTVKHSKGQYSAGKGVHTNGIENFRSVFKRGIIGIYHHASAEYPQWYVDEFCFRQNTRADTGMFNILLRQCVLTNQEQK
jgi:transposase-like protein